MRILAITHNFPNEKNRNHGIFAARQLVEMKNQGADVTVIVPTVWCPGFLRIFKRWQIYNHHWKCEYKGLTALTKPFLRPPGLWFRPWASRTVYLAIKRQVIRLHRQNPFDVIYARFLYPEGYAAMRLSKILGIPAVGVGAGDEVNVYPFEGRMFKRDLIKTINGMEGLLSSGQEVADNIAQFTGRKALAVQGVVDLNEFSPVEDKTDLRKSLGLPVDKLIVLYVGTYKVAKGVYEMIQAFARVQRKVSNVVFMIRGYGREETGMRDLVERENCGETIKVSGALDSPLVPQWMQASDLFVLASYSEGMPNAIMEAMACGLPVAATAVGGIPQEIGDCSGAILVEPKDVNQLEQAMLKIITQDELRRQMGLEARKRAQERFGIQNNTRKVLAYFTDVLENARNKSTRVCLFSTVQSADNVRMFHREAKSLAQAGFDVRLVVQSDVSEIKDQVRFISIPIPKSRIQRMLVLPWIAMREALKTKADIYHFHDPELLLIGFFMRWVLGKRVVFDMRKSTARQIMGKEYLPRWTRRIISLCYRVIERVSLIGVAVVVANDRSVAENEPCYLVRNFPRLDEQLMSEAWPMEERMKFPLLIYVGGVWESRGALIYVELARRLRERGHKFKMMIVGEYDEPFGRRLKEKIRELNLQDIVTVTGHLNYSEAMKLTAQAAIGLSILKPIPNYTFCLAGKMIEYMMCGTPVLASRFAHWQPYIEGDQTGRMVDPGNMEEIVTTCEAMLTNPRELKAMGQRGMEAVRTKYNWDREFQELLRCYGDLLKK